MHLGGPLLSVVCLPRSGVLHLLRGQGCCCLTHPRLRRRLLGVVLLLLLRRCLLLLLLLRGCGVLMLLPLLLFPRYRGQ
jgi:hypothetical protein